MLDGKQRRRRRRRNKIEIFAPACVHPDHFAAEGYSVVLELFQNDEVEGRRSYNWFACSRLIQSAWRSLQNILRRNSTPFGLSTHHLVYPVYIPGRHEITYTCLSSPPVPAFTVQPDILMWLLTPVCMCELPDYTSEVRKLFLKSQVTKQRKTINNETKIVSRTTGNSNLRQ